MDAGGFYIHEHLCWVTGIPFRLYRMSRKELYQDLVMYMLEKNIKLEQEIVSFYGIGNESMEEYFIY